MNGMGPFRFTHRAMATEFVVIAHGPGEEGVARVVERAFAEVDRLEDRLSYYRPHSDVGRANREAHARDIEVGPDFAAVLGAARVLHAATAGAFDPTVGPLMKCWRFHNGRGAMPAPETVAAARALVGLDRVRLDAERLTVRYDRPGIELDFGAIGKGYAVDKVAAILRSYGIGRALIHGGASSVFALGAPPDAAGWTVLLRSPHDDTQSLGEIMLADRAFSGSAFGPESFVEKGRHYGHELDPRTGEPARGNAAAWAVAPTATESDALSTAFFVFTPEQTRAYVEANPEVEAFVLAEGAESVRRF